MRPKACHSPQSTKLSAAPCQAAQEHGDGQVQVGATRAGAAAPEGNVEVVAQPRRETDVPPAPEVAQAGGGIGQIEDEAQLEAHRRARPHAMSE